MFWRLSSFNTLGSVRRHLIDRIERGTTLTALVFQWRSWRRPSSAIYATVVWHSRSCKLGLIGPKRVEENGRNNRGCRRVNEGVSGRPAATANGVTSTLLRLLSPLSAFINFTPVPSIRRSLFIPVSTLLCSSIYHSRVSPPYSCVCDPGPGTDVRTRVVWEGKRRCTANVKIK
jgi:hypothetical protein